VKPCYASSLILSRASQWPESKNSTDKRNLSKKASKHCLKSSTVSNWSNAFKSKPQCMFMSCSNKTLPFLCIVFWMNQGSEWDWLHDQGTLHSMLHRWSSTASWATCQLSSEAESARSRYKACETLPWTWPRSTVQTNKIPAKKSWDYHFVLDFIDTLSPNNIKLPSIPLDYINFLAINAFNKLLSKYDFLSFSANINYELICMYKKRHVPTYIL
jgi:hypothetical protein